MKKALFSLAAIMLLAGCADSHTCVQPDGTRVPSTTHKVTSVKTTTTTTTTAPAAQ